MKRNLVFWLSGFLVVWFLMGCASTLRPQNEAEMFPQFDQDPAVGLIYVHGEMPANINFYDRAGRLVMAWSEKGASPLVTRNNDHEKTRPYVQRLEMGSYEVEIRPFHYTSGILSRRRLVELPIGRSSVQVDRQCDTYDSRTGRHWGWVLDVYTGEIPRNTIFGPTFDVNFRGTGPFRLIQQAIERRW